MASFQAKIDWKRQRKRKNKIYRSVSFLPNPELKVPRTSAKKNQKLKKYDHSLISCQNRLGKIQKVKK